jgi:hypothetical protein
MGESLSCNRDQDTGKLVISVVLNQSINYLSLQIEYIDSVCVCNYVCDFVCSAKCYKILASAGESTIFQQNYNCHD